MKTWFFSIALLISTGAQAFNCSYSKDIDQSLVVSGSGLVSISAGAGDLVITGVSGSGEAVIRGKVCVSDEEWLDQSRVDTVSGETAEINVILPKVDSSWSLTGMNYAYIDLEIQVPDSLALRVRDSSGDVEISKVASVDLEDSSGDIEISDASGTVEVRDSSGDIEVSDLEGDLNIVSDSSGDIEGENIEGSVRVTADSSGDISFDGIGRDVVVERDSSGDIRAQRVDGDFIVLRDSSGDIRFTEIAGNVEIPEHKK
jgi:DUF4097 and DUF4098 domain-containing protein YvlB